LGASRHFYILLRCSFCTCTCLHIISWHTICTPQRFHHTRAGIETIYISEV
jgi:hypothetical protein